MKKFDGNEIVHLSWDPYGPDLLVTDSKGSILICSTQSAIDRLSRISVCVRSTQDINRVIGTLWVQPRSPVCGWQAVGVGTEIRLTFSSLYPTILLLPKLMGLGFTGHQKRTLDLDPGSFPLVVVVSL